MAYFGTFTEDGFPTAFYSDEIHTDIPADAVPLAYVQWKSFIDHQGQRRWDGTRVVEYKEPVPEPSTDPADYPLNKMQFEAMISILGLSSIETAIMSMIQDKKQQKIALAKYRHSHVYQINDPLFQLIPPKVGISPAALREAWMEAKDIR